MAEPTVSRFALGLGAVDQPRRSETLTSQGWARVWPGQARGGPILQHGMLPGLPGRLQEEKQHQDVRRQQDSQALDYEQKRSETGSILVLSGMLANDISHQASLGPGQTICCWIADLGAPVWTVRALMTQFHEATP